jgi:hypothetical protein
MGSGWRLPGLSPPAGACPAPRPRASRSAAGQHEESTNDREASGNHGDRLAEPGDRGRFSAGDRVPRIGAQTAGECTFGRVRRAKVPRIAALPPDLPYFRTNHATGEWSGACISMALDIAKVFNSTCGNSVLDFRSNKIDLAVALDPARPEPRRYRRRTGLLRAAVSRHIAGEGPRASIGMSAEVGHRAPHAEPFAGNH